MEARRLIDAGEAARAAAMLEDQPQLNIRGWRYLLKSYVTLHRFEDVITAYEQAPDPVSKDFACSLHYLTAGANLCRADIIQRVTRPLLDRRSVPDIRRLAPVYSLLSAAPEVHASVRNASVDMAELLAFSEYPSLIRCAHDLISLRDWESFAKVERCLANAASDDQSAIPLAFLRGQAAFAQGDYLGQAAAVNHVLSRERLSPIRLKDEGKPFTCSNIEGKVSNDAIGNGPLVTVLMAAFNAEDTIGYALESLRLQTYKNIEVLIANDASSDNTCAIARTFAARDDRFRIVELANNVGPFVAKNTALLTARGEYVINQDADDWAHPEKIAKEVQALASTPDLIAVCCHHIRCSQADGFRPKRRYIAADASSLLYRREPVLERMGYYDSVRVAGDGEFQNRMEKVFGRSAIKLIAPLLSIVSWSPTSLSGGGQFLIDPDSGIFSCARRAYKIAGSKWHNSGEHLFMPFPLNERKFPFAIE